MKAKNATPGTRVQHKTTGRLGTIVDGPVDRAYAAAVRYDDGPPDRALPESLDQLRIVAGPWRDPFPAISCRRGGVRYPQPRPAPRYLLAGVHEDADPVLAERLRALGAEFGPAVVALVAIGLSDPNYVIARLFDGPYATPYEVVTGRDQLPDDPGPQPGEAEPRGEHDPIAAAAAEFGSAPFDGPGPGEAEIRVLPMPDDDELLCILRNTGRVPVWVRGMGGGQFVAVAPDVTMEVPRTWAALPGGAAVTGFTEADEPAPADRMRAIAHAAWTEGYEACRAGQQPHSPYRDQNRPADD